MIETRPLGVVDVNKKKKNMGFIPVFPALFIASSGAANEEFTKLVYNGKYILH